MIKHFPYYLLLHSILVLWPMLLWKKFYAAEAKRKLDFLISGMEEGITSIVAGLANDTTWDRDEESIKVKPTSTQKSLNHLGSTKRSVFA